MEFVENRLNLNRRAGVLGPAGDDVTLT